MVARFLIALLLLGASLSTQAADDRHTFWSVKGAHNTVYLLGSVHLLKPADSDLPTDALRAYAGAKAVVMEVDLTNGALEALLGTSLERITLPEGKTLAGVLGSEVYERFLAQTKPLGVDPDFMSHFQPWFAAMTLEQVQLARLGFDTQSGVEMQFVARAQADHKPIIGLETVDEQLALFANLSLEQQRRFLLYSLDEARDMQGSMDGVVAAWRHGDTRALERLLGEGFEKFPDLYRTLTTDRNRKWLPTIVRLLREDQDYLVIVGALHLVGKDGVVDLLERQGYRVVQH